MTTINNVIESTVNEITMFLDEVNLNEVVIQTAFLFLNSIEAIGCGMKAWKPLGADL